MNFKRRFLKFSFVLLICIGIIFIIFIFKIYSFSDVNEKKISDAIIVMGASQWNGRPSPVFKKRLDHALSLYQDRVSAKFILTGGVGTNEKVSESQVGKNYLIENGVGQDSIFIEEIGKTSLQSLSVATKIIKEKNLHSVTLVSDGFHMMRLNKMAKSLNINAHFSAVSNDSINKFSEFKYVLRESLVYIFYLLFKV